jgi:hypothetical protein
MWKEKSGYLKRVYTLKTFRACVEIFVLRKNKLCMEKPVITQKLVLKITQICVAATQKFSTHAQFQHKSDFEH